MVHKGSCINDGVIISANSMIMGEVKEIMFILTKGHRDL